MMEAWVLLGSEASTPPDGGSVAVTLSSAMLKQDLGGFRSEDDELSE